MIKERNETLDCLKGIAILLVMFGHVQVHNHMTDPYVYDVIKSLQMPLFFLISGYLAGGGYKGGKCPAVPGADVQACRFLSASVFFLADHTAHHVCAQGVEDGAVSAGLRPLVSDDAVSVYLDRVYGAAGSGEGEERMGAVGRDLRGLRPDPWEIGRAHV